LAKDLIARSLNVLPLHAAMRSFADDVCGANVELRTTIIRTSA
jgi:hypothetical protein